MKNVSGHKILSVRKNKIDPRRVVSLVNTLAITKQNHMDRLLNHAFCLLIIKKIIMNSGQREPHHVCYKTLFCVNNSNRSSNFASSHNS